MRRPDKSRLAKKPLAKKSLAKILALALSVAMLLGIAIAASAAPAYPDIAGHWGEEAIERWSDYDVLHGTDLGTFDPDGELDVTQLAQILENTFGYTESFAGSLPGYTSLWGEEAVRKAVAAGAIEASEAALPLTRELAAKIVAKAFGIAPVTGASKFSDDYAISAEYKPYAAALGKANIFNGNDYNEFMPTGVFSRAQIMKALDNAVTDLVKKNGSADSAKSLIVNTAGVTLTGGTTAGDLIIAQGVGNGTVTLDGVTVSGRLIVYGGGSNSIVIKGESNVGRVVSAKVGGQSVRIKVEGAAVVSSVEVAENTKVIVNGAVTSVTAAAGTTVELQSAKVVSITTTGDRVALNVDSGSTVTNVKVDSSSVTIKGNGKVTNVEVTENAESGTVVDTKGTKLTVAKEAGDVKNSSGTTVAKAGESKTTAGSSSSDSGSSGGGGGGGGTTTYTVTFKAESIGQTGMAVTVTSGGTVPSASFPAWTKPGYTLSGWNTGSTGAGTEFTSSTTVTANITVYAKWTLAGGGTSSSSSVLYNAPGGAALAGNTAISRQQGATTMTFGFMIVLLGVIIVPAAVTYNKRRLAREKDSK
ncbi:MAG: InlB B-repeat-containing protein [Oscillospiraceae bacterium]|jgi:uncharacterized repeat protein (TIGR02543 family)|nr:InlB B-repeat-containing protein [Oscillospiraceae bacterium]